MALRHSLGSCVWRPQHAQTRTTALPIHLDRRRWWRPIESWACSVPGGSSRARKSLWPWSRFVAIYDSSRSWPRKVGRRSFPAPSFPAPRPSSRNTTPKNRWQAGCRDLTSNATAFFARPRPHPQVKPIVSEMRWLQPTFVLIRLFAPPESVVHAD